MKHRECKIISLVVVGWLLALCFTACGTKRQVVHSDGTMTASMNKREFLHAYGERVVPPIIDSKGSLTLDNGKKPVSTSIRWSLHRDSAFVLSLRPMGLIEVGRLTIGRNSFALLDRVNRRAFVSDGAGLLYQTIEGLTGYDPTLLRHIAQQEPFSLTRGSGMEALRGMDFSADGRHYRLTERDKRSGSTTTHLFSPELNLLESRVEIPLVGEITATYSDYIYNPSPLKTTGVAKVTELSIRLVQKEVQTYRMRVELTQPQNVMKQKVDTTVPRGYSRLTLQEVIKILKDL